MLKKMSTLSESLYQIPSHLILNDNQKEELKSLLVNSFVHIDWKNNSQKDALQFLKSHNLLLEVENMIH